MASASPAHLLEFRAGRCFRTQGTNTVKPEPAKGLVYLDKEDGLTHFYWKNITTGQVEDDYILFPGDAEVVTVPQCTTGRVIMLQFQSSSEKLFFWLQEASTARDTIILEQLNTFIQLQEDEDEQEFLESEDVAMDGVEASAAVIAPSADFAPAAPNAAAGTGTGAAVAAAAGGSSLTSQQMDQLRHLLGGIKVPPQALQQQQRQRSNLRLDHILTPGAIAPLLNNPEICAALFPHLPENSNRTPEEIQAVVRTPQFSQALVSLSTALESGQLGPLLRQFGLGPNAGDGVQGFLEAVQEQAKKDESKK